MFLSFDLSKAIMLDSIFVNLDEPSQRAVISFFDIIGKKAGWKLVYAPVVLYAFTAYPFSRAGFPSTVAFLSVFLNIAFFHDELRCELNINNFFLVKILGVMFSCSVFSTVIFFDKDNRLMPVSAFLLQAERSAHPLRAILHIF